MQVSSRVGAFRWKRELVEHWGLSGLLKVMIREAQVVADQGFSLDPNGKMPSNFDNKTRRFHSELEGRSTRFDFSNLGCEGT